MVHILKSKKGSASLEAAMLLPVVILLFVFFISILNCIASQACINESLCKTADFMAKYAFCYNEHGVQKIEENIFEKIDELLSKYIESDNVRDKIYKYVDFNKLIGYADDYVHQQLAREIFKFYLEENVIYKSGFVSIDSYDLSESSFFNGNDDIVLKISAKCGMFSVKSAVCAGSWNEGKISSIIVSNQNVWEMDNFTRGKTLRDIFGGTLPYNFPVIAAYSHGTAISIKSIDHTSETYKNSDKFEKEIRSMIDKLADYTGTDDMQVRQRQLMLIMPANKMSIEQSSVIGKVISYANVKNVFLNIQIYQES